LKITFFPTCSIAKFKKAQFPLTAMSLVVTFALQFYKHMRRTILLFLLLLSASPFLHKTVADAGATTADLLLLIQRCCLK
jgi:hypothetical protein